MQTLDKPGAARMIAMGMPYVGDGAWDLSGGLLALGRKTAVGEFPGGDLYEDGAGGVGYAVSDRAISADSGKIHVLDFRCLPPDYKAALKAKPGRTFKTRALAFQGAVYGEVDPGCGLRLTLDPEEGLPALDASDFIKAGTYCMVLLADDDLAARIAAAMSDWCEVGCVGDFDAKAAPAIATGGRVLAYCARTRTKKAAGLAAFDLRRAPSVEGALRAKADAIATASASPAA